jgi:class 3 adenylate cyclase
MATRNQIAAIVLKNMQRALETADRIRLLEEVRKYAAARGMVSDIPRYSRLRLTSAEKAWAAVLFMDMRDSTARAQEVGPRATFVTMHALLPAMAFLVTDAGGYIVGFRGDGLFAAFGIDEHGANPVDRSKSDAVHEAAICGQSMIEAVSDVVNPLLDRFSLPSGIRIGVGVDFGEIVITRIGLDEAHEVTAYGDAVNMASKLSDKADGSVVISPICSDLYPSGPYGQVRLESLYSSPPGLAVVFPAPMLGGES